MEEESNRINKTLNDMSVIIYHKIEEIMSRGKSQ